MLVLVLVAAASVAWTTIGEQRGRIFILLLLQIESQQFATHQPPKRRLWCVVGYRVDHHPTHTLETRPTSDIIWSREDFLEDCATFYSAKFSWSTPRNVVINFTSSSRCGRWRRGSTGSVLYTVQSTLLVLQFLLLLVVAVIEWVMPVSVIAGMLVVYCLPGRIYRIVLVVRWVSVGRS